MLTEGDNVLKLETKSPGLSAGPVIFHDEMTLASSICSLLILASTVWLYYFCGIVFKDRVSAALIAASYVCFLNTLIHTHVMWKKYDMPQHLDYAVHIAKHFRWPNVFDGFLTYHPPLYYTLQAVVLRAASLLDSIDVIEALRFFNVVYFVGFIIFAGLTLQRLLKHKWAYRIALTLLVFYPGGMHTAPRMDSDLLFHTMYSGTIYFLLRWLQTGKTKSLAWALALCGMSIASRSNGILLLPIMGLAGLYYLYKAGQKSGQIVAWDKLREIIDNKIFWYGVLVMLIGVSMNFGRAAYDQIHTQRTQSYLVGNADFLASIARGLRIPNELESYIGFSMKDYLDPPFFEVWHSFGGRYYFWVSVLKSSMFGEFGFAQPWISRYLNIALLCLVFYIIASIVAGHKRLRKQPEWIMLGITLFVPIMGLAANRLINPIACSQDFRYVYPAIASFCGLLGFALEQHLAEKRRIWFAAGAALSIVFIALSLRFVMVVTL